MEETTKKTLSLVERQSTFKLIISEYVQKKIREWCLQFPENEWSGTLFYEVKGSFLDNSLEITCKDFYVSDIGSSAYTEYDHKADIVTYAIENDLVECYQGLLHSHNRMASFFSKTDKDTLIEEGMAMPHFLSLIVNNKGEYTAKITRRVSLNSCCISYPTFGGEQEKQESEPTVNEYLEAFPLEIIIEEDTSIRDEVKARASEIQKMKKEEEDRKKKENSTKVSVPSYYSSYRKEFEDFPYASGRLFPEEDEGWHFGKDVKAEVDGSYVNIIIPDYVIDRIFTQMVTGSITSGYSQKLDLKEWVEKHMVKAYQRRFPLRDVMENWLDFYIEYLLYNSYSHAAYDDESVAAALAYRLKMKLGTLAISNYILEAMRKVLETFLTD